MKNGFAQEILYIQGMSCASCEMKIENKVKKLNGIIGIKAKFASSSVNVTYNPDVVSLDEISKTIEGIGYNVIRDNSSKKEDKFNINQLLGIGIILFALYTVINKTVGFNFIPQIDKSVGYGMLFVVGLLTSLHCIAMCGGINLSQCVGHKCNKNGSKIESLKPSFLYNSGRVISYTIIGGIVGAIGGVVSFSGSAKGVVAIISGIFMLIMGLNMLNAFPWLRKLNPVIPKSLRAKFSKNINDKGPFYIGLLNGLMPCGPLQAMQLYALGTGSFTAGALSMFLFSLGTVPLMFGFGAISSLLSAKFTRKMLKVSAVLVMFLGIIMVNRGLSLSGVSFAAIDNQKANIAKVEKNLQVVTTKLTSGQYSPITVKKGVPVKWIIQAEESDLNGCNNPLTIPKFNIEKKLVPGDNMITFTPKENGKIIYTCWMGMISSYINVVDDPSKEPSTDAQQSNDTSNYSGAGGCCAGSAKATKFYGGNIPTDEIAVGKIKDNVQSDKKKEKVQYVNIKVNDYGFSPAVVVIQKGVKTVWNIQGEKLNSCNNSLVFPEYNSQLNLKEGDNKLEFIPKQDFSFQCWMGMLNGKVKVVDDITKINLEDIEKEVQNSKPTGGSRGGCCGG